MNRRIFLFGLGVGIMIGAGLLQLMLIGEKQADALSEENASTTKSYTQAELDKAVSDERARIQAEIKKQPEAESSDSETGQSTDEPASDKPTSDKPVSDKPEANSSVSHESKTNTGQHRPAGDSKPARLIVRIPPNTSIVDTAELLAGKGVIPDKEAFIDLMRKRTIRAGYFAFQGKLSLDQVKSIITSTPLDPEAAKQEIAAGKN
ncbi:hypothetical protein [Paenibacillus sacheonensis]|uniref:Endolytic transglycosylase MltG n=1 Tax=Paenibacillus sacheonensis TaxID=742054 RepID=A0A7X5BY13_9BACL|nr:hypothetical protein [Paenibacillus sacheonensis]MBM7564641.1 hypothetical protein [Paenibacillus sacheonensis]NBC69197.1 hypothetical protein [Paenibacillus sacheonensis]